MADDKISKILNEHDDRLRDGDLVLQRMEGKIDTLVEEVGEVKTNQKEMHSRLFHDDGDKLSHQTIISRHDMIIKGILWLLGTLIVTVTGSVVAFLCAKIRGEV